MSDTEKSKFGLISLNLNTIITAAIGGMLIYYLNSLNTTKDAVVNMAAAQQYMLKQQEDLKRDLSDQVKLAIPKNELLLRFQTIDADLTAVKAHLQANDIDIMRLKEHRSTN